MTIRKLGQMLLAFTLTLMLAACAGSAKQESTGEYIDDTVLTSRVKSALLNDPNVSGLSINVETFKGTVQLSGFVKTVAERNLAVKLSRAVPGVRQVKNDILIR
ncbi:MAG: BON domain-containing protein [Burkholderiaceae bacterium]|nr:BON domain-containing protein [Rhodoferax sp.]MCB2004068.1 BON domain-containing protein [Rhodoferax sp.]MCB2042768.1 BON domain-containing protein [Rhodoferax sp.]MCP5260457.1 BON domain-containing protein [Rhodoferax sp.]MCW5630243.1 BON domain-containing protein [Rhodoferax sp.]